MSMQFLARLFVLFALVGTSRGWAHESMPFYIELSETAQNHYQLRWKAPLTQAPSSLPRIEMPMQCRLQASTPSKQEAAFYTGSQRYSCNSTLQGSAIKLSYASAQSQLNTLIQLVNHKGQTLAQLLNAQQQSWQVPAQTTKRSVAWQYLKLGTEHILGGTDHLLFVLCLMLIARSPKRIIITVTGFTLAHSLSLALSVLGIIKLAIAPIEACIALSIVFLAHEIATPNKHSWTWRYPMLVSSTFGLLHGLGFASALQTIGLPSEQLALALLSFNLGVELGQLAFVAAMATIGYGAYYGLKRYSLSFAHTHTLAAYGIGISASYWLLERVSSF